MAEGEVEVRNKRRGLGTGGRISLENTEGGDLQTVGNGGGGSRNRKNNRAEKSRERGPETARQNRVEGST